MPIELGSGYTALNDLAVTSKASEVEGSSVQISEE